MKKFILRLLLFCLAPLPLLFLLQHVIDTGLKKSRYYYYSEWNDLFSGKVNADLVVLGASRAWVQISPRILDSALHMNTYNLGMDGATLRLQYERFKIYLKYNKKPKYVIQEVGYTSTLVKNDELQKPSQYLPYLSDPDVWRIVRSYKSELNFLDRYFPLYKYNNEFVVAKEGIMSYFGRGVKAVKYKGYQGQDKQWDSSFHNFLMTNPQGAAWPVDPQAVSAFREYLDFCRDNGIKVIIVYPPAFIQSMDYVKNKDEILGVFNSLSAEYHIPFHNYMYDSLNYSRDNFYNSQHLNRQAAEKFSCKLAKDVEKDINSIGQ
jgi:hypothetical protein